MRGDAPPRLVLASSSPRRRELLALIGVTPDAVVVPDVDETPRPGETPEAMVLRLAEDKARAGLGLVIDGTVSDRRDVVVIAADTVVAPDGEILGKPVDRNDADRMLRLLSGRSHPVFSGIAVAFGTVDQRRGLIPEVSSTVVRTDVEFRPLCDDDFAWYLGTGEWEGRAGAYAIQGAAGFLVAEIRGSYHNVVGFPLVDIDKILTALGHPLRSWAHD